MPGASFILLLAAGAAGVGALPCLMTLVKSSTRPRWTLDCAALLPALVIFAGLFPQVQFMYTALGSLAWPVTTLVLGLGTATLLPLLAMATGRARQRVIAWTAVLTVGGFAVTLCLPSYSAEWPQRLNLEYWSDADTGASNYLARTDSGHLPATLAAAAHFDPKPRPRFPGSGARAFYAAAPRQVLAAPELTLTAPPKPASEFGRGTTHFELRLRSARGAPETLVVFPAGAQVAEIELASAAGSVRAKLGKLKSGATLLDVVGVPADGLEFSADAAGTLPVAVQVFDQSYDFPDARLLSMARPVNATSSQDGDLTVVHRTVSLNPAAGR
jgi:hypothetical protein